MNTALNLEIPFSSLNESINSRIIPFPRGHMRTDNIIEFPIKTVNDIRFKDRNHLGVLDENEMVSAELVEKRTSSKKQVTHTCPHESVEGVERSERTRHDDTESERRVVYNRPHESVEPIKDPADIEAAKAYFLAKGLTKENLRNYMMFVVNINNAVRISDLLSLKIEDVLTGTDEDGGWILRDEVFIREGKTGKTRYLFFGPASKKAITMYLDVLERDFEMTDYLFSSPVTNKDGSNKAISRQQAYNIIRKMGETISKGREKMMHLGTHSMRKTFGYQKIMQSNQDPMIIAQVSEIYNHQNLSTTYKYLGMDTESKRELCTNHEL